MKHTNIAWIGDIPNSWSIRRVKNCFYISKEKAKIKNPVVLSLARSGVKIRDISNNEGQLAASYDEYNPVQSGDLLLNPMDLYSGANCSISEVKGVISPAYVNLRKNVELNPKFFDYYFKTQYWTMAMFVHGKGVSFDNRWTMNSDSILNYRIPFPPVKSQIIISHFLDERINAIDSIISLEEKQIEKIKEFKQSLINDAVITGFQNKDNLVDSLVDWIGIVPKNWSIKKLKYAFNNRNEKYIDGSYQYVALENVESMTGLFIDTESSSYYELEGSILAEKDDVIFGKLRPYLAKSLIIKDKCYVSSEFAVFFSKTNYSKFLHYLFLSPKFIDVINSSTYGTKMPRANIDFINNLQIALPPYDEQVSICNHLDSKISQINNLVRLKRSKIEQLGEYKKSLIYEYVTGKKEVVSC